MSLYLMLAAGFVLLLVGGDVLVRGAVSVAERLGVSALMIGVVIVGFGTSMPEMVTSVEASLAGSPGIALGNIVGSNIANILLALGLSALAAPLAISKSVARRDGLLTLLATLLFVGIAFFLPLDRIAGTVLLVALAVYIWSAYREESRAAAAAKSAKETDDDGRLDPKSLSNGVAALGVRRQLAMPIAQTLGGFILLIIGGKLLIDGARGIALEAGVSEVVIGLTVVAVGTSLPEVVTCVIAAVRRHGDIALGNILGSCVYNLLAIGGVTAMISPTIIPPEIANFDNLVMLAATVAMLVFFKIGSHVGRVQGFLLFAAYIGYLAWLWPY